MTDTYVFTVEIDDDSPEVRSAIVGAFGSTVAPIFGGIGGRVALTVNGETV
ncbi:hypothetical protein [Nocardia sp. NPDC058633]|uniref:hypothetical protein n=1 Tax=Nocardia sp. NPDC058633 TaxID=3346568 RepID=UPI0036550329